MKCTLVVEGPVLIYFRFQLYQKQVRERMRRKGRQSIFKAARNTIQNITQEEIEFITSRVQEWTLRLQPVDWQVIAG